MPRMTLIHHKKEDFRIKSTVEILTIRGKSKLLMSVLLEEGFLMIERVYILLAITWYQHGAYFVHVTERDREKVKGKLKAL